MNEPIALSRDEVDKLADDIAICAARIDSATHELLEHIRTFDLARGWKLQGAESCAHWLSWRIGIGLVAARQQVRVAHRLAEFPRIDDAFRRGEISYSKVRALVRDGMPVEKEDVLLHQARGATGAQLERICSAYRRVTADKVLDDRRSVQRRRHDDGTVSIELRLLPDEAERFQQALRETKLAMSRARAGADDSAESDSGVTLADAAVAMAETQLARPEIVKTSSAERRQLCVHLREERLASTSEWKAELTDGTPLSGDTLKRIACDCGLVVAKTDDHGSPLDVGRRRRTVPPALRRALRMRDRTCRWPGCNHTVFVDAHHLEHWAQGGETTLRNCILVCHRHHVLLHEGGFRAEPGPDGLTIRDPSGQLIEPVCQAPVLGASGVAPLEERQRARGIEVDRLTSLPRWDGTQLDLEAAVGGLMP
jgi:hypothetical protein